MSGSSVNINFDFKNYDDNNKNNKSDDDDDDDDDKFEDINSVNSLTVVNNTTPVAAVAGNISGGGVVDSKKNIHLQLHKFTDLVKTFSNEFLRTIELAHGIADLHNSKFAHATAAAAAAALDEAENGESSEEDNKYVEKIVDEKVIDDMDEVEQCCVKNELNYEKLKSNKNSFRCLLDSKSKSASSISYLGYNNQSTTTTTTVNNTNKLSNELNVNQSMVNTISASNSSVYLSTSTISDSHLNQVDFCVKSDLKNSDSIPDGIYLSIWEVFIYLWGCIAFFIDIISDIILSVGYYNSNKKWLCALTLLFVIVPNVTLSLFSLSWYIDTYYSIKNYGKKTNKNNNNSNDENDLGNFNLNKQQQSNQKRYKSNLDDSIELNSLKNQIISNKKSTFNSITFWFTTILFLVLQLDLVYKYIQGFIYTLKGWIYKQILHNKQYSKYYIEKQIKCDVDIGMLRLIDVFMDSGPQVLLQLYVITTQNLSNNNIVGGSFINNNNNNSIVISTWSDFLNLEHRLFLKQVISIASSLFSMGYALAGYHRCLRNQQYLFCVNKSKTLIKPISWSATIMQFFWYLFLITPRVLSMALFASTFRSWFFMIIFIHWLIMYFWILNLKTNYCITSINVYNAREEIFEKFYNFVCSFIYIFVYFNLKSGKTRYRYLTYYIIFYLENILFSICYYCYSNEKNLLFKITMLSIILIGFWFAITFQIIYYLNCHPSQDISLCVKINNKFHFIHVKKLNHNDEKRAKKCCKKKSLVVNIQKQTSFNDIKLSTITSEQQLVKVEKCDVIDNIKNNDINNSNDKFEYKLLHLNENIASPEKFDDAESEAVRSFKSISMGKSSISIASVESSKSSMYHSISNRKQQSSYGSCLTLKDENNENNNTINFALNPVLVGYDLNNYDLESNNSLDTLILKRQIDSLKTKETSI